MESGKSKEAKKGTGRWSEEEHQRFMLGYIPLYLGIMSYGKDWKKVEEVVGTRSGSQVRSHAQKFFNKIHKQEKDAAGKPAKPTSGGISDQLQSTEK